MEEGKKRWCATINVVAEEKVVANVRREENLEACLRRQEGAQPTAVGQVILPAQGHDETTQVMQYGGRWVAYSRWVSGRNADPPGKTDTGDQKMYREAGIPRGRAVPYNSYGNRRGHMK